MIIAEVTDVQQVMIQSNEKTAAWEAQEAVWKAAMEWVEKANQRNIEDMKQEMPGGQQTPSRMMKPAHQRQHGRH